jgi:hypothetical protein
MIFSASSLPSVNDSSNIDVSSTISPEAHQLAAPLALRFGGIEKEHGRTPPAVVDKTCHPIQKF